MRSPGSLKQEFLKKWLKGLQVYSATKKKMSILERKKAIKLSADVAMASTRISTSSWSRAVMAKASNDDATNKDVVIRVLGGAESAETILKKDSSSRRFTICKGMISKRVRSKKILRKSCCTTMRRKAAAHVVEARSIAKRLVMKRTKVLKNLVPGGEFMDEISLIRETLDYILSLRLQVAVMRHLANATEKLDHI